MQIYSHHALRREISSSITILNKITAFVIIGIIIPVFFLAGLSAFSFKVFLLAGVYVTFGVIIIRHTLNLKKVEMSDTGLFISKANFVKDSEVFVPFEDIESVSRTFWGWGNGDNITVKFRRPTRFGSKIYFSAKTRFVKFSEHPIIDELSRKSQNARFQAQLKMQNP